MAPFVPGAVRVSVPATSANLGPGYDSLGLALSLRDELEAEVLPAGLEVEVAGEAADRVPRDESHLVVRSMRTAFEAMGDAGPGGSQPPGLAVRCRNRIPHSRGLGSSAAATVGGIALARALLTDGRQRLDDDAAFQLAAEIEGHPDNVGPAALGGLVISGREADRWFAVGAPVDRRVEAVVLVPSYAVPTSVARAVLPEVVPHADAAANAGRAALLVAALAGATEHLLLATRDYLHQDYREAALGESLELVRALRADGAAAVVSGAGPAVLVLTVREAGRRVTAPAGWAAHRLSVEPRGVLVH